MGAPSWGDLKKTVRSMGRDIRRLGSRSNWTSAWRSGRGKTLKYGAPLAVAVTGRYFPQLVRSRPSAPAGSVPLPPQIREGFGKYLGEKTRDTFTKRGRYGRPSLGQQLVKSGTSEVFKFGRSELKSRVKSWTKKPKAPRRSRRVDYDDETEFASSRTESRPRRSTRGRDRRRGRGKGTGPRRASRRRSNLSREEFLERMAAGRRKAARNRSQGRRS